MVRSLRAFRFCVASGALALSFAWPLHAPQAHDYKQIYAFKRQADGMGPWSGVVADKTGNLYGTTIEGGDLKGCSGYGCGTVFKISPEGTETTLYKFHGGSDGSGPNAVIRDDDGNLYGTTAAGGSSGCNGYGCGTVYKLTPVGKEKILYAFSDGGDGSEPVAGLLRDKSGYLYGTTEGGGSGIQPAGTVFRVAPDGTETVLHSFCTRRWCKDGWDPEAPLIADPAGNLYGTTGLGGTGSSPTGYGVGTVFRLQMRGTKPVYSVLYSFCSVGGWSNCLDGAQPYGGLAIDKAGNLYGATENGGALSNSGVAFKVAPDGTETVLHSFDLNRPGGDAGFPTAGVILDRAGEVIGTAPGGVDRCGRQRKLSVIYRLSPAGAETLYCVAPKQLSGVIEHNGKLYGSGGLYKTGNNGVVYSMTP